MINRNSNSQTYTIAPNCFINDNRLSWGAKGLHLYALSKPDDFRFMLKELVKHSPDGRIKLNGYVKELIQYGYSSSRPKLRNALILNVYKNISAH
jgi:hypothetical protein